MRRFLLLGLSLWGLGTILLRLTPAHLFPSSSPFAILVLYIVSFALTFAVVRQFVARPLQPSDARQACIALLLPTLVLDPFTSAFFATVFPNLPANAAGVFGGWILVSCAGGLIPVLKGK